MWHLITKEMGNTSHCSTGDLIERSRRNNQQWCCTTKSISVDLCWLCSTGRVQFSWWLRANQYWQSPVLQDWEFFCYNGYKRWSSYFDVFLFSPTCLQLLVLFKNDLERKDKRVRIFIAYSYLENMHLFTEGTAHQAHLQSEGRRSSLQARSFFISLPVALNN